MISYFRKYDWLLIVAIFSLCLYGLVMVYSAGMLFGMQSFKSASYFFDKQLNFFLLSIPFFLLAMTFNYKMYEKVIKPLVILLIILLLLVLFFGTNINGSTRWLTIPIVNFTFQPSEIAKIIMVMYFASVYAKKQPYIQNFFKGVTPPLLMLGFVFLLIYRQPDLGTATSILLACGAILVCSGARVWHMLGLLVGASTLIWTLANSASYRVKRLTAFRDPFADAQDTGYQLINSYIAIGEGGLWGRGLGQGVHKLGYLPEAHTDFILAVISEELGIVGIILLFVLYSIFLVRGVRVGLNVSDPFGKLLAFGITFQICMQVIFNAGAVSGLLPITGITLPFISYGGTSLLITVASAGILVHLSKHANKAIEAREETQTSWVQKITS